MPGFAYSIPSKPAQLRQLLRNVMLGFKLELPGGYSRTTPGPVDDYYTPGGGSTGYANVQDVLDYIPRVLRYDGLTVLITGVGEYWWLTADLSDAGLHAKAEAKEPTAEFAFQVTVDGISYAAGLTASQFQFLLRDRNNQLDLPTETLNEIQHVLTVSYNPDTAEFVVVQVLTAAGDVQYGAWLAGKGKLQILSATELQNGQNIVLPGMYIYHEGQLWRNLVADPFAFPDYPLSADNGHWELVAGGAKLAVAVNQPIGVHYADLRALLANQGLVPSQQYMLLDYSQEEYLLLRANSISSLDQKCTSTQFSYDQIWYDPYGPNGIHGEIIRRIDRYSNDMAFDIRLALHANPSIFDQSAYDSAKIQGNTITCSTGGGQGLLSLFRVQVGPQGSFKGVSYDMATCQLSCTVGIGSPGTFQNVQLTGVSQLHELVVDNGGLVTDVLLADSTMVGVQVHAGVLGPFQLRQSSVQNLKLDNAHFDYIKMLQSTLNGVHVGAGIYVRNVQFNLGTNFIVSEVPCNIVDSQFLSCPTCTIAGLDESDDQRLNSKLFIGDRVF